jgi:hypothetical protein
MMNTDTTAETTVDKNDEFSQLAAPPQNGEQVMVRRERNRAKAAEVSVDAGRAEREAPSWEETYVLAQTKLRAELEEHDARATSIRKLLGIDSPAAPKAAAAREDHDVDIRVTRRRGALPSIPLTSPASLDHQPSPGPKKLKKTIRVMMSKGKGRRASGKTAKVLGFVAENPGTSCEAISEKLDLPKPKVSNILSAAKKAGNVESRGEVGSYRWFSSRISKE